MADPQANKTAFNSQWLGGSLQMIEPKIVGSAFFVDSVNGASANGGTAWDNAMATVDQAIAKCTANSGDVIYMAPYHVESEATAANIWEMSKPGVSLVGITQGRQRPTFTLTHVDATATVSAANCVVKNCKFVSGVEDLKVGLTLSAVSDGTTIDGCIFIDGQTTILEMIIGISIAALATEITVVNSFFYTFAAATATSTAIEAIGAADRLWVTHCVFSGDWNLKAPIHLLAVKSLDVYIADNDIYQLDSATGFAISVEATTTGQINRNMLFAGKNTQAAISTADKCGQNQNYQTTVETEAGNLVPPTGDWAA